MARAEQYPHRQDSRKQQGGDGRLGNGSRRRVHESARCERDGQTRGVTGKDRSGVARGCVGPARRLGSESFATFDDQNVVRREVRHRAVVIEEAQVPRQAAALRVPTRGGGNAGDSESAKEAASVFGQGIGIGVPEHIDRRRADCE